MSYKTAGSGTPGAVDLDSYLKLHSGKGKQTHAAGATKLTTTNAKVQKKYDFSEMDQLD